MLTREQASPLLPTASRSYGRPRADVDPQPSMFGVRFRSPKLWTTSQKLVAGLFGFFALFFLLGGGSGGRRDPRDAAGLDSSRRSGADDVFPDPDSVRRPNSGGAGGNAGNGGQCPASRSHPHPTFARWEHSFPMDATDADSGEFHFLVIADMDKNSLHKAYRSDQDRIGKPKWTSVLQEGVLRRRRPAKGQQQQSNKKKKKKTNKSKGVLDAAEDAGDDTEQQQQPEWTLEFGEAHELVSKHGEAGRGMELSALQRYRDRLFACDDRSGIVFEISDERKVIPRFILMEGDGNTDKGFKCEWMAVKDGILHVGSFGKEYASPDGAKIVNHNNEWVKLVDEAGAYAHVDWQSRFDKLRKVTGTEFPGYLLHESAQWSDVHRKWFFMPRRVSTEPYNEVDDEKRGSNKMIRCDENFDNVEVLPVGTVIPTHGFSAFKFLPGSHDSIVVAVKSEEAEQPAGQPAKQSSYLLIADAETGEVLLDETEIPGGLKFEGFEFV